MSDVRCVHANVLMILPVRSRYHLMARNKLLLSRPRSLGNTLRARMMMFNVRPNLLLVILWKMTTIASMLRVKCCETFDGLALGGKVAGGENESAKICKTKTKICKTSNVCQTS